MPSLVAMLWAAADAHRDRIAIRSGAEAISYGDLSAASARFGHRLRAEGVTPGDRVALAVPNVPHYAVAHYAALLAGGVIVPLNHQHSAPVLEVRLVDARPRVLVVAGQPTADVRRAASAANVGLVELRDLAAGTGAIDAISTAESHPAAVEDPVPDERPATLVYKPGEADRPAGVVLSQHNLAWSAAAAAGVLGLTGDDTLSIQFPLFYPLGLTYGLGAAVSVGCCLDLPVEGGGGDQLRRPAADGATVVGTLPMLAARLLRAGRAGHADSAVRTLFCSGVKSLAPRMRERLESGLGCEVLEGYGTGETSGVGCAFQSGEPTLLGSVGPAVPGVEVMLANGQGHPVKGRKTGELLMRGPNVMTGYWERPKLTARALRDGWLFTGEKARQDVDGNVFLMDGLWWTDPARGPRAARKRLLRRQRRSERAE